MVGPHGESVVDPIRTSYGMFIRRLQGVWPACCLALWLVNCTAAFHLFLPSPWYAHPFAFALLDRPHRGTH